MQMLNAFAKQIDRLNSFIGRAVSWLVLVMILIGAYNAIVRYVGRFVGTNLSSNVYLELQWYLFSVIFLLGAAWTLKEDSHVRVDVLYARRSKKARRRIDIVGTIVLLLPFSVFVFVTSWRAVMNSIGIRESSPDPGGLPRYPIKVFILVCFVFLFLQGISELTRLLNEKAEDDRGDGATPSEASAPSPVGGARRDTTGEASTDGPASVGDNGEHDDEEPGADAPSTGASD